MRAYPATLTPDPDGGFTVTFRDVPDAIAEGDSREEALLRAEDALAALGLRLIVDVARAA
jgi:antitoxin HicB